MFALFNLATQEILILVVLGLMCSVPLAIAGLVVFLLTRRKDEPRND